MRARLSLERLAGREQRFGVHHASRLRRCQLRRVRARLPGRRSLHSRRAHWHRSAAREPPIADRFFDAGDLDGDGYADRIFTGETSAGYRYYARFGGSPSSPCPVAAASPRPRSTPYALAGRA